MVKFRMRKTSMMVSKIGAILEVNWVDTGIFYTAIVWSDTHRGRF